MKMMKNATIMLMLVILFFASPEAQSQGRGRGNSNGNNYGNNKPGRGNHGDKNVGIGHGKDRNSHHDHDFDENWNRDYSSHNDYRYDDDNHRNRYVTDRHYRHTHPSWAPVYGYRYHTRYIYYQDYNIYYDCHRNVFLTWSGRHWLVSHRTPDVMIRVDFRKTRVSGVDYWDDDIDFYLQRRRPAYLNISAGF